MSFVPAPQQANAANAKSSNAVTPTNQAPAAADAAQDGENDIFKMRTFDVFWVDKSALMHKDGYAKVRNNHLDISAALTLVWTEHGTKCASD